MELAPYSDNLGRYEAARQQALQKLQSEQFVDKIWKKDPAAWHASGDHAKLIPNALGWLAVPELVRKNVAELKAFSKEIADAGFQHVMVLGMGGSSLCPEVLTRTFGKQSGFPKLLVLDSTVPATVQRLNQQINVTKTLFIVASKSGSTTEPQMFYRYYFNKTKQELDDKTGQNFIAITDPGTQLEGEAKRDNFRKIFLNPADIGGRYSALSYFGMVPFALMGGDVESLLERALKVQKECKRQGTDNPGLKLGAALGALALSGRDKVTFIASSPIDSVGLWTEQLIAESTGKEGKGIVPIAGEPLASPEQYGEDRVFVSLRAASAASDNEKQLNALEAIGHPVIRHVLQDPLDLGAEFFVWEFATATAGALLGIDPFDQPNVQESKDNTKRLLAEYQKQGTFSEQPVLLQDQGVRVLSDESNVSALSSAKDSLEHAIQAHLNRVKAGDYVALTEYFDETPIHDSLLNELRVAIRSLTKAATTTGYGPRFLHSTGQLHKGGANNGVFIQITSADAKDEPIAGEPFTFGVLKQAQAIGDFESLSKRSRRAIRVDLGNDIEQGLRRMLAAVQRAGRSRNTPATEVLK